MTQKLNLRELKGAPLSIILAIVMTGNRTVSVSWLVMETGWSEKTIKKGLNLLMDSQIMTLTGYNRYQLTGENVQLPLYWGETIEPANPSPASDQPALFELGDGAENFSGKNSGLGFRHPGKSPDLEKRVTALEKRVSELEKRNISGLESGNFPETSASQMVIDGKSPETGEIPAESGNFTDDRFINQSLLSNIPEDIKINNDECGNSPESGKNPVSKDEYIEVLNELDRVYGRYEDGFRKYPEYGQVDAIGEGSDFVDDLVRLQPSLQAVEFFVPRVSHFDRLIEWLSLSRNEAKKKLLDYYGISGRMMAEIMNDKRISLQEIDYHYQYWKLHEKDLPKWTLGTVGSRIIRGYDKRSAVTSEPLKINCLDED